MPITFLDKVPYDHSPVGDLVVDGGTCGDDSHLHSRVFFLLLILVTKDFRLWFVDLVHSLFLPL